MSKSSNFTPTKGKIYLWRGKILYMPLDDESSKPGVALSGISKAAKKEIKEDKMA